MDVFFSQESWVRFSIKTCQKKWSKNIYKDILWQYYFFGLVFYIYIQTMKTIDAHPMEIFDETLLLLDTRKYCLS